MSAMRILIIIGLLFVTMTCFATLPEYYSSRQWIEQHTPKDKTPTEQRIFVGNSIATTNTYILRYHDGISLRDVIVAAHFRDTDVFVIVLRSQHNPKPVFYDTVMRVEQPKFKLEAQDVIWISTLPVAIN
jgi:hypothetical protein